MRPLTAKQRAVYEYIIAHVEQLGCQPSYRDMMDEFGFRSPSGVSTHLLALQRKGYVRGVGGNETRSLELVGVRFVAARDEAAPADAGAA